MDTFTTNIQLVYVLAAACFVVGLHLMNSPRDGRAGGKPGGPRRAWAIAVIITLVLLIHDGSVTGVGWTVLIVGRAARLGRRGLYSARTIQMTAIAAARVHVQTRSAAGPRRWSRSTSTSTTSPCPAGCSAPQSVFTVA